MDEMRVVNKRERCKGRMQTDAITGGAQRECVRERDVCKKMRQMTTRVDAHQLDNNARKKNVKGASENLNRQPRNASDKAIRLNYDSKLRKKEQT